MGKKSCKKPNKRTCPHVNLINHELFCKNTESKNQFCETCHTNMDIKYCLSCGHLACTGHILEHVYSNIHNSPHTLFMHAKNYLDSSKYMFQIYCYKCKSFQPSDKFINFYNSIAKFLNLNPGNVCLKEDFHNNIANNFKGLQNLGNTCFFNSSIQILLHIPRYINALTQFNTKIIEFNSELLLSNAFIKLYKTYCLNEKVLNPKEMLSLFYKKYPHFEKGAQHDSHEFLLLFLDALSKEEENKCNEKINVQLSSTKTFGGKFVSLFKCEHCLKVDKVVEPFLDISLPIPQNFINESQVCNTQKSKVITKKPPEKKRNTPTETENLSKHQLKKLKKMNKQSLRHSNKKKIKPESMENNLSTISENRVEEDILQEEKEVEDLQDEKQAEEDILQEEKESPTFERSSDLTEKLNALKLCDGPVEDDDDKIITGDIKVDKNYALYKLLDDFVKCESITIPHCEHCKKKNVNVNRQMHILKSGCPPILILHLKRFMQTFKSFAKNSTDISFPQILDISPYCGVATQTEEGSFSDLPSETPKYYALLGVICHTGSLRNGHYYCYLSQSLNENDDIILEDENAAFSLEKLSNHDDDDNNHNLQEDEEGSIIDISDTSRSIRKASLEDNDSGYLSHADLNSLPEQIAHSTSTLEFKESNEESNDTSPTSSCSMIESNNNIYRVKNKFVNDFPAQFYTYISDATVKKNQPFAKISLSDAYLLFYQRI